MAAQQSGNPQCPFCQLVENPEQTFDVHESENFKAWLDINPRARGHTMIVPKEHLNSMDDLGDMAPELFEVIRVVMEKAKNGLDADGVSVVMNEGEAGGQKLDHFYAQVFPRFEGEENEGAPAGAVFQPMEGLDESDLDDISSQMEAADFTEFDAAKGGPASDMVRKNRGEEVQERTPADQDTGREHYQDSDDEDADKDSSSNEEDDRKQKRSSWDGENYSWDSDGAEFK